MKTLGEFYREKILSLPEEKLDTIEFSYSSNGLKITKDLFGWKLCSGRRFIECKTEEEARYLKVFIEVGMTEIKMPKDNEYLKSILPELEHLKKRAEEIINQYIDGMRSRKIREQVRWAVWSEVLK